ncbi:MAG TPA: prolyl oligopeptidase family serine peptidase [Gemmatimonadales bacterium]|nr:prolyl oligopeptidase family serine peptidase [Gemmatimonadales bacterium]
MGASPPNPTSPGAPPFHYPPTRKSGQVDDYHGTRVEDPYRWLEEVESPETRSWVEAQNAITFGFLEGIPARQSIHRRLTELWNYERFGVPALKGGSWFYFRNDGLQNQAVLYRSDALDGPPVTLLDPNLLSTDGTTALGVTAVSEDGRLLAYSVSESGSDWNEIRLREVQSGRDLADRLQWVKFSSIAWTHDGAGFFYSRYPVPGGADPLLEVNKNHKLYYHRVGNAQDQDLLIFERPDQPDWGVAADVSDDGRYLVLSIWLGTDRRNRLYYVDLGDPLAPKLTAPVVPLLDAFDAAWGFLGNDASVFYLVTDKDAPRRKVLRMDTRAPDREPGLIIPEQADVLESAHLIQDVVVAGYLHHAHARVRRFRLTGEELPPVELPSLGSIAELSGDRRATTLYFAFTSFLTPTAIMSHEVHGGTTTFWRIPAVAFDASLYETRQVFVRSKDGTELPMFITGRRDRPADGAAPVYLYGYGGFGVNMTPAFSAGIVGWLELGGVFAMPVLRGGNEYGEAWHEAGMFERKQNVFDDFFAAAEWLIANRVTRPDRLAIGGGSNGGLLVGAALTQRPGLFGAALPAVGVMDMLRFHKFTIGWAWVPEYGSADDPTQFPALLAYSPLHNLRPGTRYPATLVTTADHDDRVVPGHSFKFAAALQAAQAGPAPALIRIETKAGHGAGKPVAKMIDEQADRWAFLVRVLGVA